MLLGPKVLVPKSHCRTSSELSGTSSGVQLVLASQACAFLSPKYMGARRVSSGEFRSRVRIAKRRSTSTVELQAPCPVPGALGHCTRRCQNSRPEACRCIDTHQPGFATEDRATAPWPLAHRWDDGPLRAPVTVRQRASSGRSPGGIRNRIGCINCAGSRSGSEPDADRNLKY